jgi:hypothetical protein
MFNQQLQLKRLERFFKYNKLALQNKFVYKLVHLIKDYL